MSYKHITSNQRVELGVLLRTDFKQKEIARMLGKDPSAISRELKRNGTKNKSGYDARAAKRLTKERRIKANQRFRKIENNKRLERYIEEKLKIYWSPEQIAGRLGRRYDKTIVCHETIYQHIYHKHPKLKRYLRCQKGKYRRRYGTRKREKAREEAKKRRIDTRPAIVEKRKRLGDWEGDTILGKERTKGILTHTERRSGYLLADKLERILAHSVSETTAKRFKKIPRSKRHTFTYDNGPEFAEYELIEEKTKAQVYFAHAYHSWERGTSENTNGLLRQFFPKKTPFAKITQEQIDKAVHFINTRPRKRLRYLTPAEMFKKNCTLD